jgi:hypothetical protein
MVMPKLVGVGGSNETSMNGVLPQRMSPIPISRDGAEFMLGDNP